MDNILNIIGIKTSQGIYITEFKSENNYNQYNNLDNYKINGEFPKKSFDKNWNIIKDEPKIIIYPQASKRENYRFVLKDKSIATDKIPLQLLRDEVCYYEDYEWIWKDEYAHLKSLYNLEYDEIEQPDIEIKFTYEQIVEVDELRNVKNFNWDIYKTRWTYEGTRKVSVNDLKYQLIDQIVFPKLYYQQHCPVTLPSKVFYNVIRFYIKNNIDLKVAEITSDYDFCFTVKKKIKLIEPQAIKKEQLKSNGYSYAKPKFTTHTYQYAKSFPVFEMTNKDYNYKEYPILPDITAENIDKLQEKIDDILKKLIEFINEPVAICPCCNGTGLNQKINKVNLNELINS